MSEAVSTEQATAPVAPVVEAVQGDPDEPLREPGKKALDFERNRANELEKKLSGFIAEREAAETAKLSELEKAQKLANEASAELAKLRTENIRATVALSKGVPADLVEFLTGDTEGDIAAKADLLLARLNTPGTPKPDPSQGARGEANALNGDPLLSTIKNKLGLN